MTRLEPYKEWIAFLERRLSSSDIVFYKFAILWISFESYLNQEYDRDKLKEFKKDNTEFYMELLENDYFKKGLLEFANTKTEGGKREYVENIKVGRRGEKTYFRETDIECFGKFIAVIYQIRCNFFHGDKRPLEPDDRKLVEWAYNSFSFFWGRFVGKEDS